MGKKNRKYRNKKKPNNEKKGNQGPWKADFLERTIELGNPKMEAYYALQGIHNQRYDEDGKLVACETDQEKNEERLRWRTSIGQILPASFRTAFDISEELKEKLEKDLEELVEAQIKAAKEAQTEGGEEGKSGIADDDENAKPIERIPFLPHAYQFRDINRKSIRKDPTMKDLFEWMKVQTEAGFITRQEAVSMVPPVVLNPQPDDCILDMCAAPGSKTCQILEKLSPKGSLVANDASYQRAYMLVHHLRRIMHNNPVVLVTSAEAQFFPQTLSFDRILADVPCSGDGTSRKNIGIWKQWSQLGALALHALQLDIAWKGVAMLKVGGYICYSTCSHNPVENEAVVAELLRRANGSLELVDAPLEGFKVRPGMSHWKVLAEEKSRRQAMNEKKKNNLKMQQRRAKFEKKEKDAAPENGDADSDEKVDNDTSKDQQVQSGDSNNNEDAKATPNVSIQDEEEKVDGSEGGKEDKGSVRQKFEAPATWDDATLIGLAESAGLKHFTSFEDVPDQLKKRVRSTCFPPTDEEKQAFCLDKCIRCLPHDNNTGGFFVALLKKVAPVSRKETRQNRRSVEDVEKDDNGDNGPDVKRIRLNEGEEPDDGDISQAAGEGDAEDDNDLDVDMDMPSETTSKPKRELKSNRLEDGKGGKHKDVGRDDFVPVKNEILEPIVEFFGLSESFPKEQIMTRAIGDSKVLYYLAKSVKENFIDKGIQTRVTIIGSGVKAFVRNTNWGSDCTYRLSQEGVHFLLPYMSKRKLVINLDDFRKCLTGDSQAMQISEFSEEFSAAVTPISIGPFVVLLKGHENDYSKKFLLVMWRCRGTAINCMVNKTDVEGMGSKLSALKEEA